ncbi:MAG: 4-alpha-glucanotransferase [Clostridiales bacterium]|nr:4-alpha-glucanotransferase [Clostridiales bacterium]
MRKSGILVHPTSFPSPYGIGDLGNTAYSFIDFLKLSGQKLWQILPLGYTSYGDSPYQSFSTFAGNPFIISPEILKKEGLLFENDAIAPEEFSKNQNKVDYGNVITYKLNILKKAYNNFKKLKNLEAQYNEFCIENEKWLNDFALFLALKNHFINERKNAGKTKEYTKYQNANKKLLTDSQIDDFYYGAVWNSWPAEIAKREPDAVKKWAALLKEEIDFYSFGQFIFFRQWHALKDYANKNGIEIIGDIPIFVAMDSADTWSSPQQFCLKNSGEPTSVAGVPPDYFSATGQLWGNPLYDWQYHKKTGYRWWKDRIKSTLKLVDILRIDHFRGFESYWSVKYGKPTAIEGAWLKGPGAEFFSEIEAELGKLPIIAEDLGIITEKVTKLRETVGFPGMKVLQFGFDSLAENDHLPHNFKDSNLVLYTGTHDNDTSRGWYEKASEGEKDYFRRYLNVSGNDAAWDLIRLEMSSAAQTVIVPIWDVINLGGENRMNTPGVASGNWQFRYTQGMLTDEMAKGLNYLSSLYGRNFEYKEG